MKILRMRILFRNFNTIIFFIAALLFACAKNETTPIELTFWTMGAEGEYVGQLIPEFEAGHPDIRIKIQSIPWGAAHEKLLTAYAGQSTPDVCQLGNTWIPEFQAIAALLPLDSLAANSSIVNQAAYFKGIWNTNVIGRSLFGIPWYVDTRLLFYRTDILAKVGYPLPPETWAEWLDASRKIKLLPSGQRPKHAVFFPLGANEWQIPAILILQNGGRLLRDNNCYGAFDDSATVEALQFYLSFFEEKLAVRKMTEVSNVYQAFADTIFSMMITGPWNVNTLRKRLPGFNGIWSTARMPRKKYSYSIAGGSSLVIFKNTRYSQAAWKFIEFLSKPEIQIKFFRLTRDLPAVKSAWNSKEIQDDQEIRAFYDQLENVIPAPKIAEWEQITVKIQEHLEMVVFGQISLQQAIADLNRDVDRILEKRRWLLSKGFIE